MSQREPLSAWLQGTPVGLPGRLWSKALIEGSGECWTWTAATDRGGYGRIGLGKLGVRGSATGLAHRVAYELVKGPIPPGLHIDHLCRNRLCINPRHLEAVTQRENNLRSLAPTIVSHLTDLCKRGHALTENAYVKPNGDRQCSVCIKLRQQVRRVA